MRSLTSLLLAASSGEGWFHVVDGKPVFRGDAGVMAHMVVPEVKIGIERSPFLPVFERPKARVREPGLEGGDFLFDDMLSQKSEEVVRGPFRGQLHVFENDVTSRSGAARSVFAESSTGSVFLPESSTGSVSPVKRRPAGGRLAESVSLLGGGGVGERVEIDFLVDSNAENAKAMRILKESFSYLLELMEKSAAGGSVSVSALYNGPYGGKCYERVGGRGGYLPARGFASSVIDGFSEDAAGVAPTDSHLLLLGALLEGYSARHTPISAGDSQSKHVIVLVSGETPPVTGTVGPLTAEALAGEALAAKALAAKALAAKALAAKALAGETLAGETLAGEAAGPLGAKTAGGAITWRKGEIDCKEAVPSLRDLRSAYRRAGRAASTQIVSFSKTPELWRPIIQSIVGDANHVYDLSLLDGDHPENFAHSIFRAIVQAMPTTHTALAKKPLKSFLAVNSVSTVCFIRTTTPSPPLTNKQKTGVIVGLVLLGVVLLAAIAITVVMDKTKVVSPRSQV